MKNILFQLKSKYSPAGDQPKVIKDITESLASGRREQTILGATGTGKTFMMASVINNLQRPTLVLAHNKTLAAQLCEEFKQFFPNNAVHYFVSYYDYYQPESYLPRSDTFIEKQSQINEEIERLRNATTQSLLTRKDVLIVASVSCIYGLGNPEDYNALKIELVKGEHYRVDKLARRLIDLQFTRTNMDLKRGSYRLQGSILEIYPADEDMVAYRFAFWDDELESIERFYILKPNDPETTFELDSYTVFPTTQYITTKEKIIESVDRIKADKDKQIELFESTGRLLQAQRIKDRTDNDIEMLMELGYCNGIENYSIYFDGRLDGDAPTTLLDYFPADFLLFVDESHITLPQVGAMYNGDRSRKEVLVEYGFRLPSALNNRPLRKSEFFHKSNQIVYVSATPGPWELGNGDFEDMEKLEETIDNSNITQ